MLRSHLGSFSLDEKAAEHEHIHSGAQEAIERFFGAADDGFVFVERSVEDEGDAGLEMEAGN